jgi:FAD binding domain-containing protein/berberine-like enzyme
MVRMTKEKVMVPQAKIDEFKAALRGELVQPGDASYAECCKVYNAMIDKKPAIIARCADATDVITAVNFGRTNNILIAVRGGGHNGGGLGTCDGGLVIDLSRLKYTRVDPKTKTVRVGGGCTWGDVDHATHPFGLAVPCGIISTTGVGGLTLGGGIGHLTRKCGLSIDNILEADIVLADGSFVTAGPKENADLFWAIHGGGGNFGIVTSFLFKCHDVGTVVAGPTLYELDKAPEVMRFFDKTIKDAPKELNGFFLFLQVPPAPPFPEELHLKKMCGILWCYAGPQEKADEIFAPIKAFGPPALYGVQPMPLPMLNGAFDGLYPPGLQWYWRADFVNDLTDEAIAAHVKFGAVPTMHSSMHLYPIDGAASKVGNSDTPWSYRKSRFAQVIVGVDPDPANNDKIITWTKGYFDALHPHSAGGAYVNFMMDEGEDRIKATYQDNYKRLSEIKKKYDPANHFRVNQNIKPAG